MKSKKPWDDPDAMRWVEESDSMRQVCRLIEGTLRLEGDSRPHEIRAAACMVILLARKNLWSTVAQDEEESQRELDRVVSLASRRMGAVKQIFEMNLRAKPELQNDPSYKKLMQSVTQEIRILDSRMSESSSKLPQEPPCTWGKFW